MPDETKEPENTPESVSQEELTIKPETFEPSPEPKVLKTVLEPEQIETETVLETEKTETVPEDVPEVIVKTTGEALTEPAKVVSEPETPQMGGNEPLTETSPLPTDKGAGAIAEAPEELAPTPVEEGPKLPVRERVRAEKPTKPEPSIREKMGLLLKMAHATIALRREKKYMKIMELFAKQTAITNDEVQGLLRVSDATATRYLSELEKRGKVKQVGTTGRGVSYVRK